ncbi:MAG: response regulator [Campylobacterota bacterium]|nr:response regulator [Campylobacterota bacterium]
MLPTSELSKLAKGLTILYVEDEPEVKEAIDIVLKHIFSNVILASNGLEGIEAVENNKVDLIITDINMPKCNGLDMIEKIKKDNPNIPVILLTGFQNSEYLLRSINLGVNKYIIKPVQKEPLFEALEEVLYVIESKKRYKTEQIELSKNLKMIAISKLLDNITHQWRQSLSIISTSIGAIMLNEDLKVSDDEIQYLLKNVDKNIKDMDGLLESIFKNFEKSHIPEIINISSIIKDSIVCFKKDIVKCNINIEIECDESIELYTNKQSLIHVLHNIIENSIEAVSNNQVDNKYIKLSAVLQKGECIVDIMDNGGGINNMIKDDIFEPYTTTKHSYIGTGLGLYIVYMLVNKSLNGNIMNSNVKIDGEKCTKITISIPTR